MLSPTAPRTLNPDRLALAKKAPELKIETVGDKKVMSDKTRTLELHLVKDNPHNDGILMAYLPAEKILIEVDLYTPLAADAQPPATVSPNTTNLIANIERLKLDVEKILALHGPGVATKADLYKVCGQAAAGRAAGKLGSHRSIPAPRRRRDRLPSDPARRVRRSRLPFTCSWTAFVGGPTPSRSA